MHSSLVVTILRACRDPKNPTMPIALWTRLRAEAVHASRFDYPKLTELDAAFTRLTESGLLTFLPGLGFITTETGVGRLTALLERTQS